MAGWEPFPCRRPPADATSACMPLIGRGLAPCTTTDRQYQGIGLARSSRASIRGTRMAESEQTYDEGRARNLEALLKALAARIAELDARGELLRHASELTKLIGDVRTELFHYEVRATYDTPDVAESRRIVEEAQKRTEGQWESDEWTPDEDDETTW